MVMSGLQLSFFVHVVPQRFSPGRSYSRGSREAMAQGSGPIDEEGPRLDSSEPLSAPLPPFAGGEHDGLPFLAAVKRFLDALRVEAPLVGFGEGGSRRRRTDVAGDSGNMQLA